MDYDLLQKLADEEVERPRGLSDSFAANKAVKKDILLKLYGTNNANIWNFIAANPKLPAEVLSAMYANDPETVRTASLRWKIARNPAASPELLARMAEDHPDLRSEIARNSSISAELRTHFLMEGSFHEKDSAVDNRKTTAADVAAMVRTGNLDSIKAAAHSRKLTGAVIREVSDKALADDSEYGEAVFLTLAHSPAYFYAMKQDPNFHTENRIHPFTY